MAGGYKAVQQGRAAREKAMQDASSGIADDGGYEEFGEGFLTLDKRLVRDIKDATAMAVWVHLCSKPKGWKPMWREISAELGIGRDKYRKAMNYLREMGVVWDEFDCSDETNLVVGRRIRYTRSKEHLHPPKPKKPGKPEIQADRDSGGPNFSPTETQALLVKNERAVKTERAPKKEIGARAPAPRAPYQAIVDLYNDKLSADLPAVKALNDQRKRAIKNLWRDGLPSLEHWSQFFDQVAASDFLCNRLPDKDFKASFDWITNSTNVLKIVEGNYDDARQSTGGNGHKYAGTAERTARIDF